MAFEIYTVSRAQRKIGQVGQIGLSPAPGRDGCFASDMRLITAWKPNLVISMTEASEVAAVGAGPLADALAAQGIGWVHFPVQDFGVPMPHQAVEWSDASAQAHHVMARGGRVLVHCRGGCGRSSMVVLRLLVEAGEPPEIALARLRAVRRCAVETAAQMAWALGEA